MSCRIRNKFNIAGKRTCRVNNHITVKIANPKPVVREIKEVKTESRNKIIISPAISRSDSTIPNTCLKINDIRLWSWELGSDGECVHTGLVSVGKICKVIVQYYVTTPSSAVETTLSCIN